MKSTIAIIAIIAIVSGCTVTVPDLPTLPDAATNAPVVVPPIVQPPATSECGCDHSLPLCPDDIRVVYDRVNGAGSHAGAGNNEVCWPASRPSRQNRNERRKCGDEEEQ